MPRQTIIKEKMPEQRPDCCYDCPLCGIIPDEMKPKGCREGYICLMTNDAITSKGVKVKASSRDQKHPLKRWCDGGKWEAYYNGNVRHEFGIGARAWYIYRMALIQRKQDERQLHIKFH